MRFMRLLQTITKKASKSHLSVDFEASQQFASIFPRRTRHVTAYPQLLSRQEAGVWQSLVNTAQNEPSAIGTPASSWKWQRIILA